MVLRSFVSVLALFAFVLTLGSGIPASAAGGSGTVTGKVVDATGAAISSAGVSAGGKTTTTDATGKYTLSGVPTGTQSITATATFFTSKSVTVQVSASKTVTAPNLVLSPNYGSISGTVSDVVTLKPISNVTVSIAGTMLQATTDINGFYRFAKAPVGSLTVSVVAAGYQNATSATTIANGATVTVNFALKAIVVVGPGSVIDWNGSSTYLLGANYPWYNYATDFGTGGWGKYTDWTSLNNGMATLKGQGVRIIRFWVFGDGRYSPEFRSDGTISGLDANVLPDIDRFLQMADANKLYILFTLVDFGMWNSGSTNGTVVMGGHSAMVTNATVQTSYLDNALKPLVQHIAASPYRARVLGYDIVNEPEGSMAGYWGGANLQVSQVKTFVQNCANYIHLYGGGAYATVGSASPSWVSTWKNLGLDFYQLHYYPGFDKNGPGSGLPTYASLALDKPCIVGEFATNDVSYTIGNTTPLSAQWYLDSIYSKGYAGALGWSYFSSDSATAWSPFAPVFTKWVQTYSSYIGPK
jgi:hypothetical protein